MSDSLSSTIAKAGLDAISFSDNLKKDMIDKNLAPLNVVVIYGASLNAYLQ